MQPQQKLTLTIIWASMMMSLVIYGVVAYVMTSSGSTEPLEDPRALELVFPGVAVIMSAAVLALPTLMRASPYQVQCIVRWALAEAIGIFGFVLLFMGGSPLVGYGILGWALVVMGLLFPGRGPSD